MMNILHTSDWHIGRTLFGRKRYGEFSSFLNWLLTTIEQYRIDVLIVAGDIFDTTTPSNRAQQLYYQFLKEAASGCCRHMILIGGNHDSPSLLEAPRELLRYFQVHVVGSAPENPADEVITLKGADGSDELIVCAVPYLRDRDIRTAQAGETQDDKTGNLIRGISDHYRQVAEIAENRRRLSSSKPPVVATGHLFAAGSKKVEGDGVRDLYVGSLVHLDAACLPETFSYLALGHLHTAQMVGGDPARRYCGAPLPMSFSEAAREKHVLVVSIENDTVSVDPVPIPCFQQLRTVRGDLPEILAQIEELKALLEDVWLEVIYDGREIVTDLQFTLREAIAGTSLEILRIVNNRLTARVLEQYSPRETLETMTEEAVFLRCLEAQQVPEVQREELVDIFRETVQAIAEEDLRAE